VKLSIHRLARALAGFYTVTALLTVPPLVGPLAHANGYAFGTHGTHYSDFEYLFIEHGGQANFSCTSHDWNAVRRLARQLGHDLFAFAFHADEKPYVVTDPAVLTRVKTILEPMQELGRKQSELGEKQSALGDKQSDIGAKQAAIGARQAEIGGKMARLAVRDASEGDDRDYDRERDALEREMNKLSDMQNELSRQQEPLARQQGALGVKQGELGRQQQKLAADASDKLEQLAHEAIAKGVAKPIGN
jgi:hypothetical protein